MCCLLCKGQRQPQQQGRGTKWRRGKETKRSLQLRMKIEKQQQQL
jgi:hypothetical protein